MSRGVEGAVDWFERLTGFREGPYAETQSRFELALDQLKSHINGRNFGVGKLELVSLGELRSRMLETVRSSGSLRFSNVIGNVRDLHSASEYAGALFQVASQFNLLEMIDPSVSPEDGVTRYAGDPTQGPACAMAAAGGLIYRNYFAPVAGGFGQTRERQFDSLADLTAGDSRSSRASGQRPADDEERLCPLRRGGASLDRRCSRGVFRVGARRPALSASYRPARRRRSDGRRCAAKTARVASLLLGVACFVQSSSARSMASVRYCRLGGGLRGDASGACPDSASRRIEHRPAHAPRRWSVRK